MPPQTADISLAAMALATFPGPVLAVGLDGIASPANDAGTRLLSLMDDEALAGLRAIVLRSAACATSHHHMMEVATESGMAHYDCVLLPLVDGGVLVLVRDQTLERNLRGALVESRRRYKDLVLISSDFIWETGADGRFVFVHGGDLLGYLPADMIGRPPHIFLAEVGDADGSAIFSAPEPVEGVEVWLRRADGRFACLTASATPLHDGAGRWVGARGVCRDITDQRERDAVMARTRNRERMLSYVVRSFREEVEPQRMLPAAAAAVALSMAADGCQVFRFDDDPRAQCEESFKSEASFGDAAGQAAVAPVLASIRAGADTVETTSNAWQMLAAPTRFERKLNGALCLWRSEARGPWSDDDRILIGDISNQLGIALQQAENHARIVNLSRTDALTGLLNRRAFVDDLTRRFNRLQREGKGAALMYVDLDNFKLVNDVHGHQRGDEALVAVRDILVHGTRATDLVARLGGDEFAVWLDNADAEAAARRAQGLLAAAESLSGFSGDPARPLMLSLGIAVCEPGADEALEDVLARADATMYEVKRAGKGSYRIATRS